MTTDALHKAHALLASLIEAGTAPTHALGEALDRYEREYVRSPPLSARTVELRRPLIERLRAYADRPCSGSWRSVALEIYDAHPRPTASLTVWMLKTVLRKADKWGMRTGDDEIAELARIYSKPRERVLSADEIGSLAVALDEMRRNYRYGSGVDALWMIALTGARVGGVVSWEWRNVAPDLRSVVQTSKGRDSRVVVSTLGSALLQMRARIRGSSPWVFAGRFEGEHVNRITVGRIMREACAAAGIRDAVVHTLRHSFATHAMRSGVSSEIVRRLLGHSTQFMSSRYLHVLDDDLRDATDTISARYVAAQENTDA